MQNHSNNSLTAYHSPVTTQLLEGTPSHENPSVSKNQTSCSAALDASTPTWDEVDAAAMTLMKSLMPIFL